MEQSKGAQILVEYQSRSTGKTLVRGAVTKEPYGYRKKGDQFMAYESDAKARPDLLRPVHQRDVEAPRVGVRGRQIQSNRPTPPPQSTPVPGQLPAQEMPEAPTQWRKEEDTRGVRSGSQEIREIEWGKQLNKSHVRILFQNNVRTLADAREKGFDGLIAIKGIGKKTADILLAKAEKETSFE